MMPDDKAPAHPGDPDLYGKPAITKSSLGDIMAVRRRYAQAHSDDIAWEQQAERDSRRSR